MRNSIKFSLAASCAAIGIAAAQPAFAQQRNFNVPAQDARQAIPEFARQAGIQISAPTRKLRGIRTRAINGTHDVRAALMELIRTTGLKVVSDDGSMVILGSIQSDLKSPTAYRVMASEQAVGGSAAASAPAPSADAGEGLADIVVTAQRREEKLQTVPISITVVSQKTIEANNIQSIGELQYLLPSVSALSVYSRDGVNLGIRGQQAGDVSATQAVVTYLNEVPIPTTIAGNVAGGPGMLFDLENVQVLKGPQGTLFGRNSTGGAVLFQSARPKDEFGGNLQIGLGNYNNREVNGVLNVPLAGGTLINRLAFSAQDRDGFTHVLATPKHPNGVDADDRQYWSIRNSLKFRPSESFQNDLIVSYTEYKSNGSPTLLTGINPAGALPSRFPSLLTYAAQQQALGPRVALAESVPLVSNGDTFAVQNITRADLTDGVQMRNIIGYAKASTALTQEYDGTPLALLDNIAKPFPLRARQFTEELQFQGTAFDNKLDWIVGGFYLESRTRWLQTSAFFFNPDVGSYSDAEQESKAAFGQFTYALVPQLKFRAGGRKTWDEQNRKAQTCTGGAYSEGFTSNVGCGAVTPGRAASSAFTWTLGLDYQLNRNTLLYVASRKGYRAGGFNGGLGAAIVPEFGPEYVQDVELGLKTDVSLGTVPLRLNIAGYRQSYTDIQIQTNVPIGNNQTAVVISNAGKARIWGAEVEATLRPIRGLELGGTFGYLDLKYTEFAPNAQPLAVAQAQAGRRTNRPPFKYTLNGRYTLPLNPNIGDITLGANWSWQDTSTLTFITPADAASPYGDLKAFGVLNMSVDWSNVMNRPIDASFFMSNVADKLYQIGVASFYTSQGLLISKYGAPRMYGFRLKYRFGADDRR